MHDGSSVPKYLSFKNYRNQLGRKAGRTRGKILLIPLKYSLKVTTQSIVCLYDIQNIDVNRLLGGITEPSLYLNPHL